MTLEKALRDFEELAPGRQIGRSHLIRWLSELDGAAVHDVFDNYEGGPEGWTPYDERTPVQTQLLLPAPHDRLYLDYLRMQADNWAREPLPYNNSAQSYNTHWQAFADDWARHHAAKQPKLRL